MASCGLTVRLWLLSLVVLPGVEALPVSAPTKVNVVVPAVLKIFVSENSKSGDKSVQVNASCEVVSELPEHV